jgi:hypothetical protein
MSARGTAAKRQTISPATRMLRRKPHEDMLFRIEYVRK